MPPCRVVFHFVACRRSLKRGRFLFGLVEGLGSGCSDGVSVAEFDVGSGLGGVVDVFDLANDPVVH